MILKNTNPNSKITVMLVAVNQPFVNVISLLFKRYKDMTLTTSTGECERVLTQVDRIKPALILLDLDMPNQMGLELIACLHRAQLNLPIIALSQMYVGKYRQEILKSGLDEVIEKFNIPSELGPTIRRVLTEKNE